MFFHIGERQIISAEHIVGIFNRETIENSEYNEIYKDEINETAKSVIIDNDDEVITSMISSFTLIDREPLPENDLLWKRRK